MDVSETPLPRLPERDPVSHKGDFGRAMLIGGSRGMAGAAAMAGLACLRGGAGLVTIATPRSAAPAVAAFSPAYTTMPLVEDDEGRAHWANASEFDRLASDYDAWAIGPGLGPVDAAAALTAHLYASWLAPVVVDADGLNGLARYEETRGPLLDRPAGPRVLTPHPGEFARLVGDAGLAAMATGGDQPRVEAARVLAARDDSGGTVVVLKGHRSVVTDGQRYAINPTGNPGMATGGCGDVLTGLITALLCQGLPPLDAARLAVYAHGLAGDLAAAEFGQVSLIATDLIAYLPKALMSLE